MLKRFMCYPVSDLSSLSLPQKQEANYTGMIILSQTSFDLIINSMYLFLLLGYSYS